MNHIRSIIWDWNGTLLDDVAVSLKSVNRLLAERNLEILTPGRYHEVFTFPVQEYYERIGFDFSKEPFDIVAHQFIEIYNEEVRHCGLHDEAEAVLEFIREKGMKQYILSAMEQELLEETVNRNGISAFFEDMCGLDNKYAVSKVETGMKLIRKNHLRPEETLLIGDTTHDFDAATAIGCACILVANGHQPRHRLEPTGATIIGNIKELIKGEALG